MTLWANRVSLLTVKQHNWRDIMPKACLYSSKHFDNLDKDADKHEALQSKAITLLGGTRKAKKPAADDSPLAVLRRCYLSDKPKKRGILSAMLKYCPVKIGDEAISTGCRPGLSFKVDTITVEPHNGLQFVMIGQIIKKCGNLGKQRGRCQIAVEDLL